MICSNNQKVCAVNTQFTQVFQTIHWLKNYHFSVEKLYPFHLVHVIQTKCVLCVTCINNLQFRCNCFTCSDSACHFTSVTTRIKHSVKLPTTLAVTELPAETATLSFFSVPECNKFWLSEERREILENPVSRTHTA